MSTFEWFLLIVVVIGVPLVVAVVVTLWTLEQARQRNRKNRSNDTPDGPVKRNATRVIREDGSPVVTSGVAEASSPRSTPAQEPGSSV